MDFCRSICLPVFFFFFFCRKTLFPYRHSASNLRILKRAKISGKCGEHCEGQVANRFFVSHTGPQKNYFPHVYSFGQQWCYMKSVKSKPNTWLKKCESEENTLNAFETMQCTIYGKLLLDNKNMNEGADALVNRK